MTAARARPLTCARGRSSRLALALLALAATGLAATSAAAHVRSLSYSSWNLAPDGGRVRARVTSLDLSALPRLGAVGDERDPVGSYLAGHLRVLAGATPCRIADGPTAVASSPGWATYEWRVVCPSDAPRTLESRLFSPENPAHLHFARVATPAGDVAEHVLAEGERTWALPRIASGAPASSSLLGYIGLGIEHILSGWDHLAFVLALLLLARSLAEVATLVTAFTIAHSVTLALAVLGVVRPEQAAVEALIGFSIALVAAENGWLLAGRGRAVPAAIGIGVAALALLSVVRPSAVRSLALLGLGLFSLCHFALLDRSPRPGRLRALVAFAFGLVHGFGFAGVLAELDLPPSRLAAALVGFNAGVEIGQLAVVVAIWPVLLLLGRARGGQPLRVVAELGSAAICGLGLFWFLTRTFG